MPGTQRPPSASKPTRPAPPRKRRRPSSDAANPVVTSHRAPPPHGRDSASPAPGEVAVVSGALPNDHVEGDLEGEESEEEIVEGSSGDELQEEGEEPRRGGEKARHVWFESDDGGGELESDSQGEASDVGGAEEEEDESSDDEAPEAVTRATAEVQSRTAAAGIAKALERQRLEEKKRRRERDERLKENAKQATAKRREKEIRPDRGELSEQSSDEAETDEVRDTSHTSARNVPHLLPDELLADPLFERPPTPEAEDAKAPEAEGVPKKRLLDVGVQRPEDIQVGPVKVSVLDKSNALLAPKVSPKSRSLRENWISGKRGVNLRVPRKEINGGFAR